MKMFPAPREAWGVSYNMTTKLITQLGIGQFPATLEVWVGSYAD